MILISDKIPDQIYDRVKEVAAGLSLSPEGEVACQPDGMNDSSRNSEASFLDIRIQTYDFDREEKSLFTVVSCDKMNKTYERRENYEGNGDFECELESR